LHNRAPICVLARKEIQIVRAFPFVLAALALHAQSPTFEVASVKLAAPPDPRRIEVGARGGPGTKDPGRWSCKNMRLQDLIVLAYDVQPYQISGPSWLVGDRFDIDANVAPAATKADLRLMIQNLLAERFRLQLHREQKETATFELVVAKSGPKLTESPPREGGTPLPNLGGPLETGKDGFPVLPPGVPIMVSRGGRVKRVAVGETMEALASMLARQVARQVTDRTGLAGKYDFTLFWAMPGRGGEGEDLGPSLMTALQEQLGLRLETRNGPMEVLAIDRVEKRPTEN
jgi:uncharacterized protein (TIGR03435 family)